jgi:uncharacterized repeat protein (TIGR03847 family)
VASGGDVSDSFEFDAPDHVTAGAIGVPGERVFYLQARQDGRVVSLRLEKQQVAALCEYLAGILADLAAVTEPLPATVELIEPAFGEWIVGALAVAYEEADDRILLVAEELLPEDEDDDAEGAGLEDVALEDDAFDRGAATARFRLTRAQVEAMVRHAKSVVTAGRPICPVCGRPMDPAGHFCPRNN